MTTRRPLGGARAARLLAVGALLAGACSAMVASQTPSQAIAPAADAPPPQGKPLQVALSFATLMVETETFAKHRADKDCTDTYLPEQGLRELLERAVAAIGGERARLDTQATHEETLAAARRVAADVLVSARRTLSMDMASAGAGVLLCRVRGTSELIAWDTASGRMVQSAAVAPDQIESYGGESQAFAGVAGKMLRTIHEGWRRTPQAEPGARAWNTGTRNRTMATAASPGGGQNTNVFGADGGMANDRSSGAQERK